MCWNVDTRSVTKWDSFWDRSVINRRFPPLYLLVVVINRRFPPLYLLIVSMKWEVPASLFAHRKYEIVWLIDHIRIRMCELACVNSYHWRLDTTRLVSRVVREPVTRSGRTNHGLKNVLLKIHRKALQVLKAYMFPRQIEIYLDKYIWYYYLLSI